MVLVESCAQANFALSAERHNVDSTNTLSLPQNSILIKTYTNDYTAIHSDVYTLIVMVHCNRCILSSIVMYYSLIISFLNVTTT